MSDVPFSRPCVRIAGGSSQEPACDEEVEKPRARLLVESPQPLGLLQGELQPWHLEVFTADALEYPFIEMDKRLRNHVVLPVMIMVALHGSESSRLESASIGLDLTQPILLKA